MLDPEALRRALDAHPCRSIVVGGQREAAVLVPVLLQEEQEYLLFTRRTDHLPHHQGEISFPGGARHPQDRDLLATALREAEEEIGLHPADVTTVGRLDDFASVHNFHVVPFVGLISWPYPLRPCPQEIAEVIVLPLAAFSDPTIYRQENWQHRGRSCPVDFYTVGGHVIWGLTAAILRLFLQRLPPAPAEIR
ncbi:MAG: CoA pyrophosphatase [Desulfuromonadales bacterium]|nr:CoA pyrophosphatase [Desulfuromonadales bacterium]